MLGVKGKYKHHVSQSFIDLIYIGFFTFVATGLDDVIVYSTLLLRDFTEQVLIIAGIVSALVLQFVIVFYFSSLVNRIKNKEIITVIGLLILAGLVGFEVI